jgi:very-short-patch-repair endonuclease
MTFKDFLKFSKGKPNDEFLFTEEYWRENYVSSKKSKFRFKCSKNHTYETTIDSYIRGTRCSICRASKGEQYIVKFLKDYQIKFVKEKTFKDCKNEKTDGIFRFDFFLLDYNLIIEYDGKQHFEEVEFFNSLEEIQSSDLQKNDFCYKNNINLIRIPYWCLENIDFILKTILFQLED